MSTPRPLPYDPADETPPAGEADASREIDESMASIQRTTYEDYGHAVRSVHAKSHALLEGFLEVPDDLPAVLAQGLFSRPATYPVVLRISTNPGDVLDDAVSTPRGFALKIVGVEGERLPGSEGDAVQDFLFVNTPTFGAGDAPGFVGAQKLVAATTDRAAGLKKAVSAVFRGATAALDAVGAGSGALTGLGGQPLVHPLGDTYYTTVPFRHGDYVAKLSLAPSDEITRGLEEQEIGDVSGHPNALREAMIEHFATHGARWELRVQLRTDADTMPIEDASVEWPESESPYLTVATVRAPAQPAWSEPRAVEVDDALSFHPWHGLEAHRPLGSLNRARHGAYERAAAFRAEHNGCPLREPHDAPGLSNAPPEIYGSAGREGRRDLPSGP